MTKAQVLTPLAGLQHELHHDQAANNIEILNEVGDVESQLRESQHLSDVGIVIRDARAILDRATKRLRN